MLPKYKLKNNETAVVWLGQSGFYFQSAKGLKVIVDPYLSDSCRRLAGKKFKRMFPVPMAPKELNPDIFLITHDHLDHLDEDTVKPVPNKDKITFIGPRGVASHLKRLKIKEKNIVRLDAGERTKVRGIEIESVFAMPTDAGTIDTVGFIVTFENKLKIYITGDTAYSEFLGHFKDKKIDVMFTVINGFCNNLNEIEGAKAVKMIKPKTVIPMHFGCLGIDRTDVSKFVDKVKRETNTKIIVPKIMLPIILTKD